MGCCSSRNATFLPLIENNNTNEAKASVPKDPHMKEVYSELMSLIQSLVEEENWEKLITFAYCQVKIPEKKAISEIVLETVLSKLRESREELIPLVKTMMPYFLTLIETSELGHKKLAMTYLSEIIDIDDRDCIALFKTVRTIETFVSLLAYEDKEINRLASLICNLFFCENKAFKVRFCQLNGVDSLIKLVDKAVSSEERNSYLKMIKNVLDEEEPLCFKQISLGVNLERIEKLIKDSSDQTSVEIYYLIEYIKGNLNTGSNISPVYET